MSRKPMTAVTTHRYSIKDVAAYTCLSVRTLDSYSASGKIPFIRVGGRLRRYSLPDVCRSLGLPEPASAEAAK